MNHYETLGIKPDATPDEIKKAYRRKCAEVHPDREGGDDQKMAAVNVAYEVLSDPEKRKAYDERTTCMSVQRVKQTLHQMIHVIVEMDLRMGVTEGEHYTIKEDLVMGINDSLRRATTALESHRKVLKQMKKLKGRYRSKATGEKNVYEEVVDEQISGVSGTIKKLEEEIEIAELSLKLVDDLERISEDSPPRSARAFHGFLG